MRDMELTMEENLHLLYIAKKYHAFPIENACRAFACEMMTVSNVLNVHEQLQGLNEHQLQVQAFKFIAK